MNIPIFSIMANDVYNYWFSIVFFWGLVAIVPAQIFKLLR